LGPGETDYGLPPLARRRELLAALGAPPRLLARAAIERWDGRRLRARVAAGPRPALVSLGSGPSLPPGWIGADLVRRPPAIRYADLRRPLPFRSRSLDGLLLEHSLEHLVWDDVLRLVGECARVLRPGAPIRIVCPDAGLVARLVLDPDHPDAVEQVRFDRAMHVWPEDGLVRWRTLNRLSHQWGQHRALLDGDCLVALLTAAGFVEVAECPAASSRVFAEPPSTHGRLDPPPGEAVAVEGRAPQA
jgi:predicted SAM-dependent methyltransferase